MRDVKLRLFLPGRDPQSLQIPLDQLRALDRRLALDKQQRAFREWSAPQGWVRPRRPA